MARTLSVKLALLGAVAFAAPAGAAVEGAAGALHDRSIAYVMTSEYWGVYQTDGAKEECPDGLNEYGPREQFKAQFPDNGTKRSVVDTQLAREGEIWFPHLTAEPFPFVEAKGAIGIGVNLDGKIGPNDFTSPEGDKGIDNQLFRAIGCVYNYRREGELSLITTKWRQQHNYNRVIVELTDVDSLVNDDDVTVTTYRGLDKLQTDASGTNFLPGGSQRIDMRWGKMFIQRFHARIKDGVLTTEARDLTIPEMAAFEDASILPIRGAVFQLKVTPDKAVGLLAGYFDLVGWYTQLNEGWATHHQSYGQQSAQTLWREISKLADGYPDPKTGKNTAISGSLRVEFSQVFVHHPERETAKDTERKTARDAR